MLRVGSIVIRVDDLWRQVEFWEAALGYERRVGDDDSTSDQFVVERTWTRAAAMRIAGGTDEILRNIIAERVLGLPEEARLDKGIPFNEIPR